MWALLRPGGCIVDVDWLIAVVAVAVTRIRLLLREGDQIAHLGSFHRLTLKLLNVRAGLACRILSQLIA
jgi:hypothetical protein